MDIFSIDTQEILDRISRHCPEALSVYLQCVNLSAADGTLFFSKDLVEINMSEEWRPFLRKIKQLARENLLEWHPFNEGVAITLADLHAE